ncbi:nucleotidyl transferase AbiEii/AbiGii toxin family protein, partial [Micromonospora arborensis]|uniref:nucleotidyl transferase AbiEii/AbiGii toxin family protein n=1 Tax=Micromonospora arborensis TaxID=2116518 RepID=UPI003F4DFC72
MAGQTPPIHRRLAQIALQVGGQYGFALAGGHAIAAHGILDRPSEDVDLFTDWQRRADFPTAVDEVIAAYRAEAFRVDIDLRGLPVGPRQAAGAGEGRTGVRSAVRR